MYLFFVFLLWKISGWINSPPFTPLFTFLFLPWYTFLGGRIRTIIFVYFVNLITSSTLESYVFFCQTQPWYGEIIFYHGVRREIVYNKKQPTNQPTNDKTNWTTDTRNKPILLCILLVLYKYRIYIYTAEFIYICDR